MTKIEQCADDYRERWSAENILARLTIALFFLSSAATVAKFQFDLCIMSLSFYPLIHFAAQETMKNCLKGAVWSFAIKKSGAAS